MFIKKLSISLLTISSFMTTIAYAEDKIAIVETRKVVETSLAYKDISTQIQKKNDEFRDEIQKEETSLKKKYQELETKKNALSQEAIDKKNEAISKEVAELQKRSYNQHSSLEDAYRNSTQVVVDKTMDIVKKQASKKHYNLVIEKAAAVYSDEALDITDVILEELNKALPNVEVKFEEKKEESKK